MASILRDTGALPEVSKLHTCPVNRKVKVVLGTLPKVGKVSTYVLQSQGRNRCAEIGAGLGATQRILASHYSAVDNTRLCIRY